MMATKELTIRKDTLIYNDLTLTVITAELSGTQKFSSLFAIGYK